MDHLTTLITALAGRYEISGPDDGHPQLDPRIPREDRLGARPVSRDQKLIIIPPPPPPPRELNRGFTTLLKIDPKV